MHRGPAAGACPSAGTKAAGGEKAAGHTVTATPGVPLSEWGPQGDSKQRATWCADTHLERRPGVNHAPDFAQISHRAPSTAPDMPAAREPGSH